MLTILKNDPNYHFKMQDLTTVGIGFIVAQIMPRSGNELHDLRSIVPYSEAILHYLNNGIVDEPRMRELRTNAKNQLLLSEATWQDVAVEEIMVAAAGSMHDARRRLQLERFSPRDPQWFMRLPLAFIGWDKARVYCEALIPVVELIGISGVTAESLRRAYFEQAASELYKYGVDNEQGLAQAMRIVAMLPNESKLSLADCEILHDSKFVSTRLRKQLERYGIGTFNQMRELAEKFGEVYDQEPFTRQTAGDALLELV